MQTIDDVDHESTGPLSHVETMLELLCSDPNAKFRLEHEATMEFMQVLQQRLS